MDSTEVDENFRIPLYVLELLKQMQVLLENKRLCDVVLIAGIDGKRFAVHKVFMSAASPYFLAMFTSSMREAQQDEVTLNKIDGDTLAAIIQYIYSGKIKLEEDTIEAVLDAACLLQLYTLETKCCNFVINRLDSSNCLGFAIFAEQRNCSSLSKAARNYMKEHFEQVCKSEEFKVLAVEDVEHILRDDYIEISSEEAVFQALMSWVQHDPANRNAQLPKLLPLIRMQFISASFITDHIKPICESIGCQALVMSQKRSDDSVVQACARKYIVRYVIVSRLKRYKSETLIQIISYYIRTNKWTSSETLITSRISFGISLLNENELIVVGGYKNVAAEVNTVECLNLKTMTMRLLNPMNIARHGVTLAVLNGLFYAIGGFADGKYLNTVERYDPKHNKWDRIPSLIAARVWAGVAAINDRLYVVGGYDVRKWLSSVEFYDPNIKTWRSCAPMSKPLRNPSVEVSHGYLYVVGESESFSGCVTNSMERYNPSIDSWTPFSVEKRSCEKINISLLRNRIIAVSCVRTNGKLTNIVEQYDPINKEWRKLAPMNFRERIDCIVALSNTSNHVN